MNNSVITLNQLAAVLAEKAGISPEEAANFITSTFSLTAEGIASGKNVTVKDLGVFSTESDSVVFLPSPMVAKLANEPFEFFEPVELKDEVTEEVLENATPVHEENPAQPTPETDTESEPETEEGTPAEAPVEPVGPTEPEAEEVREVPAENENDTQSEDSAEEDYDDTYPEVIYQTKAWPIVLGVLAGFVAGLAAGALLYASRVNNTEPAPEPAPAAEIIHTAPDSVAERVDTTAVSAPVRDSVPEPAAVEAPKEVKKEAAKVYDTVTSTRFLATMAREHYGATEYWIFIYEENRDILPHNPNRIKPGTKVVIPPLEKYVPGGSRKKGREIAGKKIAELQKSL